MLWDATASGDAETLKRYIKIDGHEIVYRHDYEDENIELAATMRALARFPRSVFVPVNLAQYLHGDLVRAALFFIQQLIDERLAAGLTAGMIYDAERDRLSLQGVPRSLLGALWYQCARALTCSGAIADASSVGRGLKSRMKAAEAAGGTTPIPAGARRTVKGKPRLGSSSPLG